jgi:hypothetical protein
MKSGIDEVTSEFQPPTEPDDLPRLELRSVQGLSDWHLAQGVQMLILERPLLKMKGDPQKGTESLSALEVRILCGLIGGIEQRVHPVNVSPELTARARRYADPMRELSRDRNGRLVTVPEAAPGNR